MVVIIYERLGNETVSNQLYMSNVIYTIINLWTVYSKRN